MASFFTSAPTFGSLMRLAIFVLTSHYSKISFPFGENLQNSPRSKQATAWHLWSLVFIKMLLAIMVIKCMLSCFSKATIFSYQNLSVWHGPHLSCPLWTWFLNFSTELNSLWFSSKYSKSVLSNLLMSSSTQWRF